MSERIFGFIIEASVTAGIAAAAAALAGLFIKRVLKASVRWAYMLWAVVFFRCLCPVSVESGLSVFNLFDRTAVSEEAGISVPSDGEINFPASFKADDVPSEIVFTPSGAEASGNTEQIEKNNSADVYTALLVLWGCGAAAMAAYGIISSAALASRLKTAVKAEDGVFESDRISTAFTAGIFRPGIYLPCGLPENQRELIILHERIHIRRRDYILKPIAFAGLALHWFNPLIWAAFALMTRDMEMSCDEAALKICGSDKRTDYSEALLSASVRRSGIAARIGFGETGIKERVKNVLDYKKPKLAATLLAAAVMLTACASVGTDAETEETGSSASDDALNVELNDGSTVTTLKVEQNDGSTVTTSAPKEEDGDGSHIYVDEEGDSGMMVVADKDGDGSNIYVDEDGNAVAVGGSGKGNEGEYVPGSTFDEVTGKLEHEDTPDGGVVVVQHSDGDEAEDSKPYLYYSFGESESELSSEEREKLEEEQQRLREEEEAKAYLYVPELESSAEYQQFLEDIDSSRKLKKPVDSEITEPYAERDGVGMDGSSFHKGVDFKVKEGDTVCAADGGKVIAASDKNNGYGICVIIDHGNGMATLYAHLSEASVSVDDEVEQGDEIGKAGHTGKIYGDGLHFEVRIDGQHTDPMNYLDN